MATVKTLWGRINLGPEPATAPPKRARAFKSIPCDGHFIAFEVMFSATDQEGWNEFESLRPLAVCHSEAECDRFCADAAKGWLIHDRH